LIDKVISELSVASRIVIKCRRGTDLDIFNCLPALQIETLNGCDSPETFGEEKTPAGHYTDQSQPTAGAQPRIMGRAATFRPSIRCLKDVVRIPSGYRQANNDGRIISR
jgi:hypothetical protein